MTIGILPNVSSRKRNRDVSSALNAPCSIEQPNKKSKKDEGKSAVAIVKSVRQLSLCVTGHLSRHILQPIRRVRFTRATLRHENIREKKRSVGR